MGIVCSACGTKLMSGRNNSEGCGFGIPEMALLVDAPAKKRARLGFTFWASLIAICAIMMVEPACKTEAAKETVKETVRPAVSRNEVLAELHQGKLNTPEAFQARCGQASSLVQMPSGPALRYNSLNLLVTFPNSAHLIPRFQAEDAGSSPDGHSGTLRNVDEKYALDRLHCGE
jgi:hypothetical protein